MPLYHLTFDYRPADTDELFNLRHASARNVIEQIFGVLKRCFRILVYAAEIDMDLQAHIPAALAAIHNFMIQRSSQALLNQQIWSADLSQESWQQGR